MKNIKLLLLSIILLAMGLSKTHAQNEETKFSNELRFGFFQIMMNEFYMSYEKMYLNYGTSLSTKFIYKEASYESKFGIQLNLDQKFYMPHACDDIRYYLAPGLKYRYVEFEESGYTDRINTIGIQLVGGFKIIWCNTLTMDTYFGGMINKSIIDKNNPNGSNYDENYLRPGFSGISPVINCTFGLLF